MNIQSLVVAAASADHADMESLARVLSQLGWRPRRLTSRDGRHVLSVGIGELPQILFARPQSATESSQVVSLGYSHEAKLAVDWHPERFAIHPTLHWKSSPGDSPMAEADGSDVENIAAFLFALGPGTYRRMESRRTRRALPGLLAERFADFRRRLREVDEWMVRPATDPFLFFHQLLFARVFEDRHPALPPGRVASASNESDLSSLLDWYRNEFDSELFSRAIDVAQFPWPAVDGLVGSMTRPWQDLELDFSVSEDDLAGRLYESYLERAVVLDERESQLFAWARFSDLKKQSGAYYTPAGLANHVVRRSLEPWLDQRKPLRPEDIRVLDPACGSGAFLAAAFQSLLSYFTGLWGRDPTESDRVEILEASLFGTDIDREALMLARLRLLEIADVSTRPLPVLDTNLLHRDALAPEPPGSDWRFEVVLANPPFAGPGLSSKLLDTDDLRGRFPSVSGTGANLAFAFVDLALGLLAPGGSAGFVLPRVVLDGDSGAALRHMVGAGRITFVSDLGANQLFEGANAYVCLLGFSADSDLRKSLRVERFSDRGIDREEALEALSLGQVTGFSRKARRSSLLRRVSWTPFWIRWCDEIRPTLGGADLASFDGEGMPRLVIGTQLGHQQRFTFDEESVAVDEANRRAKVRGYDVPLGFLPRYVRGRNVRPFQLVGPRLRVVVPRLGESEQVDALVLSLGGVPESARPGNLRLLRGPKVLIRSLSAEPAAVADFDGGLMPAQGGAGVASIVPRTLDRRSVAATEALLNSAFYQWLLQGLGHPKAGAVQVMRHHYAMIPWPRLTGADLDRLARAGDAIREALTNDESAAADFWACRRKLDEAVFDVLGVPGSIRQVVDGELWREL